ncbi:MAG: EamA family transporter [SAR324 cluster bacterium]|nr:EamA family transporter [SAR324 cluster bacterium]
MPIREMFVAGSVPLIWAFGFIFAKAGLHEFPPLMLMGFRFCLTALLLVWFVARPAGYYLKVFQISMVSATLQYGLTFTGLSQIDASLAIIIIQLEVPFGVLSAAILLGERPGLQRLLGMLVAFAGIGLIAGQPNFENQLFPMLLTASGAAMWSIGQVMVKQLNGAVGSFSLIAWVGVFSGPQMLLASWIFENGQIEAIQSASWVGWGAILYLALGMTALGYGIWYAVLSRNHVSQVMPFLLLMPIFTIILSVLILDETLGTAMIIGGITVLIGLAIITFTRSQEARTS